MLKISPVIVLLRLLLRLQYDKQLRVSLCPSVAVIPAASANCGTAKEQQGGK
jgi:hypothetical protein